MLIFKFALEMILPLSETVTTLKTTIEKKDIINCICFNIIILYCLEYHERPISVKTEFKDAFWQ